MEYTATRDNKNPRWNDLLDHVKELNDQLFALANFHLGDNVKARLTDDDMMCRATSSIADACLEVTDATCVIMATMRSIICKHVDETQRQTDNLDNVINDNSKNEKKVKEITESTQITPPGNDKLERVMTTKEVALFLSKSKKEVELVHVLEHAISMMKQLAQGQECFHFWLEKVRNKNVAEKKSLGRQDRQVCKTHNPPQVKTSCMSLEKKKSVMCHACFFFF